MGTLLNAVGYPGIPSEKLRTNYKRAEFL